MALNRPRIGHVVTVVILRASAVRRSAYDFAPSQTPMTYDVVMLRPASIAGHRLWPSKVPLWGQKLTRVRLGARLRSRPLIREDPT
jgi:hypothetical protein